MEFKELSDREWAFIKPLLPTKAKMASIITFSKLVKKKWM
jgi:hypothetical protein